MDIPSLLSLRDETMRRYLEEVGMPTSIEEYEKRIRFEFSHAQIVELDGNCSKPNTLKNVHLGI